METTATAPAAAVNSRAAIRMPLAETENSLSLKFGEASEFTGALVFFTVHSEITAGFIALTHQNSYGYALHVSHGRVSNSRAEPPVSPSATI